MKAPFSEHGRTHPQAEELDQSTSIPVVNFSSAIDEESGLFQPMVDFQPLWQLPNPLRSFSGRRLQLSRLNEAFQKKHQHLVIQHPRKITGTGGIGKTQLAVQFAHTMVQQGRFKNVIWLNANTTAHDQLRNEIIHLANALNINTKQAEFAQIISHVYDRLSKMGETLIVFDSAVSYQDLEGYLPHKNSPISVLVTTRDSNPWSSLFEQLPLDIFTLEEALEFIKLVLPPQIYNANQAERVAEKLGRFPLALAQATSYIVTRNISIDQYLALYNQKQQNQRALLDKKPLNADPHQETIWVTVNLCTEQITSTKTLNILRASSILAAEAPIDIGLLQCWTEDQHAVQSAVKELQNYSLVEEGTDTSQVRIHQLVQDIIILIQNTNESEKRGILLDAAEKVQSFYNIKVEPKTAYRRDLNLLPHIRKIISNVENGNENEMSTNDRENNVIASLESMSGNIYELVGDYSAEQKSYLHALNILESLPSLPFKRYLLSSIYNNIGVAYGNTGDVDRKIHYLQEAIKLNKEIFGDNLNRDRVTIMGNLANAYGNLGDFRKKIELLESILQFEENNAPSNDLGYALTLDNLATAYIELHEYKKAEGLLSKSLRIYTHHYGDNHPETAKISSNLASLYSYDGRPGLALAILHKAKKILESHYGPLHIRVAKTLTSLAYAYGAINDQQRKLATLQTILKIKIAFYGPHHPETAKAQCNLADHLRLLNMLNESLAHFNECIPIILNFYGWNNVICIRSMSNYAACISASGDFSKAEKIFIETTNAAAMYYNRTQIHLLPYYKNIAAFYVNHEKHSQAIQYCDKALSLLKQTAGNSHPDTALSKIELASLLITTRQDLLRAKKLFLEAQPVLRDHKENPKYDQQFVYATQSLTLIDSLIELIDSTSSPQATEADFERPILDGLLNLTRIESLENIYLLIEECIGLHHNQLALSLLRQLKEHKQITVKLYEVEIQICLRLNNLDLAMQDIEAAYELGSSDKIASLLQNALKDQDSQSQTANEKEQFLIKWHAQNISQNEILQLAIRCTRLGQYTEAMKFLNHPQLLLGTQDVCAAVEFQRARCAFILGEITNALDYIDKSLTLKKAPQASALRTQIIIATQCFPKLQAAAQSIAWHLLPGCDSKIGKDITVTDQSENFMNVSESAHDEYTPKTSRVLNQSIDLSSNISTSIDGIPTNGEHSLKFQALWQLPNPLRFFSGRKLELHHLKEAFQQKQQHLVIQHPKKITGTGGIGKTQLAVQFAHDMVQQGRFKNVIWINADTSTHDRLRNEFMLLANALNVDTKQTEVTQVIINVYQQLANLGETLVVFDSATSYEDLQNYLPPKSMLISVLVTTRDGNPWTSLFEQLPLDIFTLDEALEFIQKVLRVAQYDVKQAEVLAELLGRFPLGLAQATGYIVTRNITIEQYIALYLEKQNNQLALLDRKPLQTDPHQETIWLTVNLCLEQISSAKTRNILQATSNLAAETPIDIDLLQCWEQDQSTLLLAVKELQNYSLIEEGISEDRQVRIHQLVQDIAILILSPNQDDQFGQLSNVAEQIKKYYHSKVAPKIAYKRNINLLPHIRKTVRKIDDKFDGGAIPPGRLHDILTSLESASGSIYEQTGNYVAEKQSFHRALALFELLPSSFNKSFFLANTYNNLANAYGNIGDIKTKIQYLQEAIRINKEISDGKLNLELLAPMTNLAMAYGCQGDYLEKAKVLENVLYIIEKCGDSSEINIAEAQDNLATAYLELEEYGKAEGLYKKSMHVFIDMYGSDHPKTVIRTSNLALLYAHTNRVDQAIVILEKAKTILTAHYGPLHNMVAKTLVSLAAAYSQIDNHEKELELYREVVMIKSACFGARHPETAKAQCNLANSLRLTGKVNEALQYLNESIPIIRDYYGENNTIFIDAMFNYGLCLNAMRNFIKAEEIFFEAMKSAEKLFGNSSQKIISYIKTIAGFYTLQKKHNQAIIYLDKVLHLRKIHSGENHPDTAVDKAVLATSLILCQHIARARTLCTEALSILSQFSQIPMYQPSLKAALHGLEVIDSLSNNKEVSRDHLADPVNADIETPILDGLLDFFRIDSIETIYILIEQCIALHHEQIALSLLRTLQEYGHMSLEICELTIHCSLKLNYLEAAMQYIETAFEFGGSDRITTLLEQALKTQDQQTQIVNEKEDYLKKWQAKTITTDEILQLVFRCTRLGEYEIALEFLQHSSLNRAPNTIRAATEYQRAICSIRLGKCTDAIQFITTCLALNDDQQARSLRDQIYTAAQSYPKILAAVKKIAWDQLPECDSEVGRRLAFH